MRVLDPAGSCHQLTVSPTQLRVLSLISARPRTNVNGLAELLDVVPSAASRLCDRLEAIGLLRRVADPRGGAT
ncbi:MULTISPECIES: MarR family transcriptional regulator [unclassified Micromonospora]|uniref:MarR family transcriptional regulator n=1 Tax=unclassified Micromonospora TaxID=2617518 RepID=UPI0036451CBA